MPVATGMPMTIEAERRTSRRCRSRRASASRPRPSAPNRTATIASTRPAARPGPTKANHLSCWRSTPRERRKRDHERGRAPAGRRSTASTSPTPLSAAERRRRAPPIADRVLDRRADVDVERPGRERAARRRSSSERRRRPATAPAASAARASRPSGNRSGRKHAGAAPSQTYQTQSESQAGELDERRVVGGERDVARRPAPRARRPTRDRQQDPADRGSPGCRDATSAPDDRDSRRASTTSSVLVAALAAGDAPRPRRRRPARRRAPNSAQAATAARALTRRSGSRSQSDTCAGCIVSRDDARAARAQRVELDLVAQPRAEGLDGAGGVVAAPVEAPVDERLDARARRPEQRRHRERRAGDGEVGLLGERAQRSWKSSTSPR